MNHSTLGSRVKNKKKKTPCRPNPGASTISHHFRPSTAPIPSGTINGSSSRTLQRFSLTVACHRRDCLRVNRRTLRLPSDEIKSFSLDQLTALDHHRHCPGVCCPSLRAFPIRLWEGFRESRSCSRDTYPESYITDYLFEYKKHSEWERHHTRLQDRPRHLFTPHRKFLCL